LGAEGENRRVQPLLADRVGLKPRITEGYERATGLVAALSRARMRRIFGRRTLAVMPAPKRKTRFAPLSWRALPLPRSLKASRKTSPCTGFGLFPDMERVGSSELALSSAGRGRLGRSPS